MASLAGGASVTMKHQSLGLADCWANFSLNQCLLPLGKTCKNRHWTQRALEILGFNFGVGKDQAHRPRHHGARAAEDLPCHPGRRTGFGSWWQGIASPKSFQGPEKGMR